MKRDLQAIIKDLTGGQSVGSLSNLATDIAIADGGTGASDAPTALANLGALPLAGGTMTGVLTVTAGPVILDSVNMGIEIGKQGTSNTPYIDFHSGATNVDYDARIIASGGNGTSGQGTLNIVVANLQYNSYPMYACRAWVRFDGTTRGIWGAGNVSSISYGAVGKYVINFTNALPDTAYAVVGTAGSTTTGNIGGVRAGDSTYVSYATNSVAITVTNGGDAAYADLNEISVVVFR